MTSGDWTRRQFIAAASAGSLAAAASTTVPAYGNLAKKASKLAILGGEPVRKNKSLPDWPQCDDKIVESVVKTTRSGNWCRIQGGANAVVTLEKEFAKLEGAKFCVATGSGTQSLHTCVEALGIGPGDEIITSPYTDPASFQLDPAEVEKRINENTKAIMPVHMMGQSCDIDSIMAIAKKHNLKVIEDAAQAHLAEHRGRKLGTIGDVGCFSFQSSKVLACGEGGAIIGNDEALMDKCYTVHNHGTSRKGLTETIGPKYRMNEFEAAVLLGQWPGLLERHARRNENAAYLTSRLKDIPCLVPQKLYEGTNAGSFYLYAMSYHKEHLNGIDRATFLKALNAEGVNLSPYIVKGLHREPWIENVLKTKVYQTMYSPARLRKYREESACPKCDQVCEQMAMIWASGPLLASHDVMVEIADAIEKVYVNRDQLKSA